MSLIPAVCHVMLTLPLSRWNIHRLDTQSQQVLHSCSYYFMLFDNAMILRSSCLPGAHPYPTVSNDELPAYLESGKRLQKPEGIDQDV